MIQNRCLAKQLPLLLASVILIPCAVAAETGSAANQLSPEDEAAKDSSGVISKFWDEDPEASPETDVAVEEKSPEKSGINSFSKRFKKSREKKEPKSYIQITDDFVNTSGASDLEVGKEPTPEQLKNLKEDMVWIKEETIGGYTISYPVVYIAGEHNKSEEANKTEAPDQEKKKK